jgi:hypothetical protein
MPPFVAAFRRPDCRSGTCFQGYLYYNGYIAANRINSVDARGKPNGVMGVPESYRPSSQPVFPTPKDGGNPSDPNFAFYETNTVFVKLKDGSLQRTTVDTNLHPWRNRFIPGPMDFGLDAAQPDSSTGILSLRNSQNTARQLQLTLRLTW